MGHYVYEIKLTTDSLDSLPNSSTTQALVTQVHQLLQETDGTGDSVRVFLVDFSKALIEMITSS